ncbi:MAG: alpha/beta fold hydrolase [Sphingomonadales bacterium]|nr:alpha/beta fold hydrolase [Sphingomonadales bacterium]
MPDSPLSALPALLLPGLICDARIWAPQVEGLRDRFAVTAINGYGEADSLGAMAECVLAQAPDRFALAGHSMGGRVALEIFRRVPERVAGIALVSTGVHLPRPGEADGRFALLSRGVEQGMEALVDAWLPPMVWEPNRSRAGLMDNLTAMCLDVGLDSYERQIRGMLARPEVESLLPTIRCPAMVAVGEHDAWASAAQNKAIADAIPGASFVCIPDAGHMVPVEAPQAMTDALARWLETVYAGAQARS